MQTETTNENGNMSQLVGTTIDAAAIQHRQDFVKYVLEQAEPWHRLFLTRLYTLWRQWNERFFHGRMVEPYLLLNEPTAPQVYGCCGSVSGFGGKSEIRIRPSLLTGTHPHVQPEDAYAEGRFLFVADVLLHEMIHQYQQEALHTPEASFHGHGPVFRDEANRIGALLGLPRVRTSKARGKDKDLPSCSSWPHIVRPADYYQGAYKRPELEEKIPTSGLSRLVTAWEEATAEERQMFIHDYIVSTNGDN